MRSGGCAVQQELGGDAAAVVRQAVSLARRRGHAQVTPLHVASAALSDAGGLLRAACLRSRASSHPLQCKALELCFNVALNRLATAAGVPPAPPAMALFQFHHAAGGHRAPALSNALAAALKRAQANHRRGGCAGSASDQHQHGAAKVVLEQLVISILDDPSVSRVMREAGFASAEVKADVEKTVSSPEQSSNTASSSSASPNPNTNNATKQSRAKADDDVAGDAARVLDCMASGATRCVVVVGESAAAAEAVVKAVMDKVSKGELRRQHERLKRAQFVPVSAASFRRTPREEVEARAGDLCALVRECCAAGKRVVLVLEDLSYAAEAWAAASGKRSGGDRRSHHGLSDDYCPVEHAVMALSSLVRGGGGRDDKGMFWLLGFGASASYTSCRSGKPSLETVLGLHPVVVPDGGLALSHAGDSEVTHCGADRVMASVPSWIRRCQGPVLAGSELTLSFSSLAPSSHFRFTHDNTNKSREPWHDLMDRRQPLLNQRHDGPMGEPHDQLSLANPNSGSSNSVSNKSNSSDGATTVRRRLPKFTELTAENLKILCSALETRVPPRHRDIAPGIAGAVLRRRSGVTRTTRPTPATWLVFQGRDHDGKVAMARELARLVFGSYDEFTCIATTAASKLIPDTDHSGSSSLKRQRSSRDNEPGGGRMQMFYEAIRENPHRVVLFDGGVEHDSELEAGIMDAMTSGTVRGCDGGGVVSLEDSIVVCCQVLDSSMSSSPRVSSSPRPVKQRTITSDDVDSSKVEDDDGAEEGVVPRFSLDLNACAIDGEGEEKSSSCNAMDIQNAADGVFLF